MENLLPIAVLCTDKLTTYSQLPYVFPFDIEMNCRSFTSSIPVITHAPCAQWSRLHSFAKINLKEKDLAFFCYEKVMENGGIFEHPAGSHFFKYIGVHSRLISIDQNWFGFPARKRTYLFFNNCHPGQFPLSFNAIEQKVSNLSKYKRSFTTLTFASWLVNSIRNSYEY